MEGGKLGLDWIGLRGNDQSLIDEKGSSARFSAMQEMVMDRILTLTFEYQEGLGG